jgi:hypothetical protein
MKAELQSFGLRAWLERWRGLRTAPRRELPVRSGLERVTAAPARISGFDQPLVLLVAALLAFESAGATVEPNSVVYFVGIDGARFKRPVEPGDQLILDVTIDRQKAGIWKFKTRASVDGEIAVEADLMCTLRNVG